MKKKMSHPHGGGGGGPRPRPKRQPNSRSTLQQNHKSEKEVKSLQALQEEEPSSSRVPMEIPAASVMIIPPVTSVAGFAASASDANLSCSKSKKKVEGGNPEKLEADERPEKPEGKLPPGKKIKRR